MHRVIIALLMAVALAALPEEARSQNRWAKGIGSSYIGAGLQQGRANITRDASINWLRYSSENDDMQSSFGNYEMAVLGRSNSLDHIIAESYRHPDDWPPDPGVEGTTDYSINYIVSGMLAAGGTNTSESPNPLAGRGIVTHIFKQAPPTVNVDAGDGSGFRDRTVRQFSHRPSTADQILFAADGDRVNAGLVVDEAVLVKALNGPGTETTAWLYGSGVEDYTDHIIQTWSVHNSGRVPLFSGQDGYFVPGSGGTAVHAASAVPAEIAAEEPTLGGMLIGMDGAPGGLSIYDIAAKNQPAASFYEGGFQTGSRGEDHWNYDDINKIVWGTDGDDENVVTRPNRGDQIWSLGPQWTAWNFIPRKMTPGEFTDADSGGFMPLHIDETPVPNSASPTLASPNTAAAGNLAANWLVTGEGTEGEQPYTIRVGTPAGPTGLDGTAQEVYENRRGDSAGPTRADRTGTHLGNSWVNRPSWAGKWQVTNTSITEAPAAKWQDGLDHASLDYTKGSQGWDDVTMNIYQYFGPWDVPFNNYVHAALALMAGGNDRSLNQIFGQMYAKKTWLTRSQLDTFQDLFDSWDHLQTFAHWKDMFSAKAGQAFTEHDKHFYLNSAFDSLYAEAADVKEVWAAGIASGFFGPKYPTFIGYPTEVSYQGAPGKNNLSWEAAPGATSYNIYRTFVDYGKQRRFVANVTGLTYDDTKVDRGTDYYYAVAAVDGSGREGTQMMTLATNPVAPLRGPSTAWVNAVVVVPNPYNRLGGQESDGGFLFSGNTNAQNSVKFINLPARATINIFSTGGDLINTLKHTDGTGEESWYLVTDNNQRPASGLYLCHIQNDDNPTETRMLRLVIVR
jgi:hypothetical protein